MKTEWMQIIEELKRIHGKRNVVPLHEPTFSGNEVRYVTDTINSGWVSSVGAYVDEFERKLAEYTGVKRAVAVVNGTAALHIALKLAGVKANEEVLMPSLTFVATANAVAYLQAIPNFVDVSLGTLGIDPTKLEIYLQEIGAVRNGQLINKQTGRVIKALLPMHTFGHPVDLEPLLQLCKKYNLILIEDAAESLGSYYRGQHTGSFGLFGTLSFNGNKIITTGGGGAILTNDIDLAEKAKHITTTAKIPHRWKYEHDEIGFNYRMPNINAALGCAQIEKIEEFIDLKRQLTLTYEQLFQNIKNVELFKEPQFAKSNYWLQTLIVNEKSRDELLQLLNEEGILARPIWNPLHEQIMYQDCPKAELDNTLYLKKTVINIPSSPLF